MWWLGWGGCAPEVTLDPARPPGVYPVVEAPAWTVADTDPFAALRPDPAPPCARDAWGAEELSGEEAFSVDTADCGYLTVAQPSLVELVPGDEVAVRLWHFDLDAPDAAVANLGLAFAGEVVWREVLPIPRDAALLTPTITVFDPVAPGEPVHFHVSNHGRNSYSLISVELRVPGAQVP